MAYVKKNWKNRQSENPNRRRLTATGEANVYDVARVEGLVLEEGDAFDQVSMNDLEERIAEGFVGTAPSSHNHTKNQISDFPTSLPANGGNADTVDGKHATEFVLTNQSIAGADLFAWALTQTQSQEFNTNPSTLNTPYAAYFTGTLKFTNGYRTIKLIDIIHPEYEYTATAYDTGVFSAWVANNTIVQSWAPTKVTTGQLWVW